MTQTSETQAAKQEIPAHFRYVLAPGEQRIFTHDATGITVKLFHVAGGMFIRLEVRAKSGGVMPERCQNYESETAAVRDFVATLQWLIEWPTN